MFLILSHFTPNAPEPDLFPEGCVKVCTKFAGFSIEEGQTIAYDPGGFAVSLGEEICSDANKGWVDPG